MAAEEVEAYLMALPQAALDRLYADPWTCQAVFRCLSLFLLFFLHF